MQSVCGKKGKAPGVGGGEPGTVYEDVSDGQSYLLFVHFYLTLVITFNIYKNLEQLSTTKALCPSPYFIQCCRIIFIFIMV